MNINFLCVELLLDCKADIRACDNQLNTALHHACKNKHVDCAMLLLERIHDSAIINMANKFKRT